MYICTDYFNSNDWGKNVNPKKEIASGKRGVGIMADKERQEDEMLRECLQDAYGYSDEELLKEMEEAENSLDDTGFAGAEERIYQRIMEKEAAEKTASEKTGDTGAAAGKKVKRIGKKKVLLAAALVAVFVGTMGVSAVGEKNYFFRKAATDSRTILDNDKNLESTSKLEKAYEEIIQKQDINVLKLGYIPSELKLSELAISQDRAVFRFDYKGNQVYFVQGKRDSAASADMGSDRKKVVKRVKNKWINQTVEIFQNELPNGESEYEVRFYSDNAYYYLMGIIDEDEFIKMVENVNFF